VIASRIVHLGQPCHLLQNKVPMRLTSTWLFALWLWLLVFVCLNELQRKLEEHMHQKQTCMSKHCFACLSGPTSKVPCIWDDTAPGVQLSDRLSLTSYYIVSSFPLFLETYKNLFLVQGEKPRAYNPQSSVDGFKEGVTKPNSQQIFEIFGPRCRICWTLNNLSPS
jgi:hypothetical protein